MSRFVDTMKNAVFNVFHIAILGKKGNLETISGNTKKFSPAEEKRFKLRRQFITKATIWLLKVSGGRLGNSFLGRPIVLLTTIGHKSGLPRTQPVYFMRDGKRIVLVASNGGAPDNPAWLLNAQAHPLVTVAERGIERKMKFRIVSAEEKAELWPRLIAMFPMWQEVEDRSQRRFPVALLEPVAPEPGA